MHLKLKSTIQRLLKSSGKFNDETKCTEKQNIYLRNIKEQDEQPADEWKKLSIKSHAGVALIDSLKSII